jgi:hypothetical protein
VRQLRHSSGGSAKGRRDGGALGDRRSKTRRRREGIDRTREIQGFRQFARGLDRRRHRDRYCWGQHKGDGSNHRTVRIVTARHRARHHSGHVVPAIHVIRRRGRRFLVMMLENGALIRSAAAGLIRRPRGSHEGGVQQNDHEQTDACGNRTPTMVTRSLHLLAGQLFVVRHYGAKRHSLQAGFGTPASMTGRYTPIASAFRIEVRRFADSQRELCWPGRP